MTMTTFKNNNEYILRTSNIQEFYQLIGELTMTFPNHHIFGVVSLFQGDELLCQSDVKVSSIWKYREFIESFTIEDGDIKFWINL